MNDRIKRKDITAVTVISIKIIICRKVELINYFS